MGVYLSTPETEKSSEDGENGKLRFGLSSMQGWNASMEDAHAAYPDLDASTSFFGVYDGHGDMYLFWRKEIIWLVDYLEELGNKQFEKILSTDSQSAIQLVKNPVYHSKTKHIRRRYHFTLRSVEDGEMCLEKIECAKNPAHMFTKCVDVGKLRLCKTLVGLL